jgi:hypothetical protein
MKVIFLEDWYHFRKGQVVNLEEGDIIKLLSELGVIKILRKEWFE